MFLFALGIFSKTFNPRYHQLLLTTSAETPSSVATCRDTRDLSSSPTLLWKKRSWICAFPEVSDNPRERLLGLCTESRANCLASRCLPLFFVILPRREAQHVLVAVMLILTCKYHGWTQSSDTRENRTPELHCPRRAEMIKTLPKNNRGYILYGKYISYRPRPTSLLNLEFPRFLLPKRAVFGRSTYR